MVTSNASLRAALRLHGLLFVLSVAFQLPGCTFEQPPDTLVATFPPEDSESPARVAQILAENGMVAVSGFFLGDSSQPPANMIFVERSNQTRAAELVAADAKEQGYAVTVHFPDRTETFTADITRETAPDEPPLPELPADWAKTLDKEISVDLGGGVEMEFILVPPGEFIMGSSHTPEEEAALFREYGWNLPPECFEDERPPHRVRITRPFYLGKYEVTVAQFKRFADQSGYKVCGEDEGAWGWNMHKNKTEYDKRYSWRHIGFQETDDHPVVNMSWNSAMAFCAWLSRKTGKTYRLPTEAQWEYACRAGTTTRFCSGDDPEMVVEFGNVPDAAAKRVFPTSRFTTRADDGYAFTSPVGRFKPNAFGLYDMHGNVWEWCADWYDFDYCADSPMDDPVGPRMGSERVLRGGSWDNSAGSCRSSHRKCWGPVRSLNDLGFRVLRVVGRAERPVSKTE